MGSSVAGLRSVTKDYAAVRALSDVSLDLRAGEIHVLLGENGSGKSTLVNLLAGAISPSEGTVTMGGRPVEFSSPHAAMQQGIVTIFQHSQTFPDLTVAENILLGHEHRRWGVLTPGQRRRAGAYLDALDAEIALDQKVGALSVAGQQIVAIAKAMSMEAKLLILDEPTASLGHVEAEQLSERLTRLRESGLAIVYITHRMAEVKRLADVVSVLKDGHHVTTQRARDLTADAAVKLMVGRELSQLFPTRFEPGPAVVLRARDLSTEDGLVTLKELDVREGEIVGIAGLEGSGRARIARMLAGVERSSGGTLSVHGRALVRSTARKALDHGIAFVPPDRVREGIISTFTVRASITQSALPLLSKMSLVRGAVERREARSQSERMRVKTAHQESGISTLSGGNQQKVLIARTLAARAKVIVMDEPTAGVDVGARGEIYTHLSSLAADGIGMVISSSDMVELIGVCHRILVVRQGRVVACLNAEEATEEKIMAEQLPIATLPGTTHREVESA